MNKCGNVYFCKPVICLYLILKSHDYRQSFYTVTHCEPCVGCQKRGWRSPDFLSKSSQSTSFVATHTDRHCPEVSFQIPAVVKLTNVKILLSPNIYPLVSHLRILKPQSQTAVTGFAVFLPVTPPPTARLLIRTTPTLYPGHRVYCAPPLSENNTFQGRCCYSSQHWCPSLQQLFAFYLYKICVNINHRGSFVSFLKITGVIQPTTKRLSVTEIIESSLTW